MAVQFEFYKNPVQGEEEGETSYHPKDWQPKFTRQLPLARPKWKQC